MSGDSEILQPSQAHVSLLSLSILEDRETSKLLDVSSASLNPDELAQRTKNKLTSSIQLMTESESDELVDRAKSRNLSLSVDTMPTNTILL